MAKSNSEVDVDALGQSHHPGTWDGANISELSGQTD